MQDGNQHNITLVDRLLGAVIQYFIFICCLALFNTWYTTLHSNLSSIKSTGSSEHSLLSSFIMSAVSTGNFEIKNSNFSAGYLKVCQSMLSHSSQCTKADWTERTEKADKTLFKLLNTLEMYHSVSLYHSVFQYKYLLQNVPAVSELARPSCRGYLWRLSTKRMVYTHDWKRKYFVLTGDKLFYYDNELGDGVGPGAGVIHLDCFIDCVEAPLTDHKKATNVFILLAKERGLFEQVRYQFYSFSNFSLSYYRVDIISQPRLW